MRGVLALLVLLFISGHASAFEPWATVRDAVDFREGWVEPSGARIPGTGCEGGEIYENTQWLRFTEGTHELGCARYRIAFEVPAGTTHIVVEFEADRVVTNLATAKGTTTFEQTLELIVDGIVESSVIVFPEGAGNLTMQPVTILFPLPQRGEFQLAWTFADRGSPAFPSTPGPSVGAHAATVQHPHIESVVGIIAKGEGRMALPKFVADAGSVTLHAMFDEPHSIAEIVGPKGQIGRSGYSIASSENQTFVHILPLATSQHREGVYEIHVQALAPGQTGPAATTAFVIASLAAALAIAVLLTERKAPRGGRVVRIAVLGFAVISFAVYAIAREALMNASMNALLWNTLHTSWIATIATTAATGGALRGRANADQRRVETRRRVADEVLEAHAALRAETTDQTPWRKLRYDVVDAYVMMFHAGWDLHRAKLPLAQILEQLWDETEPVAMESGTTITEPVCPNVDVWSEPVFVPAALNALVGACILTAGIQGAPVSATIRTRRDTATLSVEPIVVREPHALEVLEAAMQRLGGRAILKQSTLEVTWRCA